jgi:hypothetical protein
VTVAGVFLPHVTSPAHLLVPLVVLALVIVTLLLVTEPSEAARRCRRHPAAFRDRPEVRATTSGAAGTAPRRHDLARRAQRRHPHRP